ncbi:hypothetical protein ACP70R_020644 [Stipagrostis hirtigluma subsp. patula]
MARFFISSNPDSHHKPPCSFSSPSSVAISPYKPEQTARWWSCETADRLALQMAMPWETAACIAHSVFVLLDGWVCTCVLAADEAARLLRAATPTDRRTR